MPKETFWKDFSIGGVYKILLLIIALFTCFGFVDNLYSLVSLLSHSVPAAGRIFILNIAATVCRSLMMLLYLIILYQLYRLLLKVVKGEPFDPENPRRIRKVAYGTFGIGALMELHEAIFLYSLPSHKTLTFDSVLWIGVRATQLALFGVGILIIAKILEIGVKLQQDQNLTV